MHFKSCCSRGVQIELSGARLGLVSVEYVYDVFVMTVPAVGENCETRITCNMTRLTMLFRPHSLQRRQNSGLPTRQRSDVPSGDGGIKTSSALLVRYSTDCLQSAFGSATVRRY
jgi:hypothetical protein